MSTLKEQLQADMVASMKAGNKLETSTLRTVLGVIQTQEKAGKTSVSFGDKEIVILLRKEAKERNETAADFDKGGRPELGEQERAKAALILNYLPTQLNASEVEVIVDRVLLDFPEATRRDFETLINAVMAEAEGATERKTVSGLIGRKLH